MALRASVAASSRRRRACSSWAIAVATWGCIEPIAVIRSSASASSSWSVTCRMPVTARCVPSTDAATFALTSSTLAIVVSRQSAQQRRDPDAHAGQQYRREAGDDADQRGAVDLSGAVTVYEADRHPAEAER